MADVGGKSSRLEKGRVEMDRFASRMERLKQRRETRPEQVTIALANQHNL